MNLECEGKRVLLDWAIEDVIDEYFGGDEDFITHLTIAFEDYCNRKLSGDRDVGERYHVCE